MESVIARPASGAAMSVRLDVDEVSQVGGARRQASALAHAHAMDGDTVGRLALIVTELATNIVRHGRGGSIVLRPLIRGDDPVIEVLALDKGPGIANMVRAMEDGYSTGGSAGQGLGAIRRLSDVFDIHSQRGLGTAVMARVGRRQHPMSAATLAPSVDDRLGVVCVPMRGESECGDAWDVAVSGGQLTIILVDGLGHGPEAATAASTATRAFGRHATASHDAILAALDGEMHATRGAAVSVISVNEAVGAVTFTGVGNVDVRLVSGGPTQYLVPQNGIVGHGMPVLRSTHGTLAAGGRVIMHSDGIVARWRMDAYERAMTTHPALMAGMIYRDFARERDDALDQRQDRQQLVGFAGIG